MTHILLADDDRELSDLLSEYLQSQGLETTAVFDGATAVKAATNGKYDLMVLDIMMPKMNGLAVLKQLGGTPALPVIMLTAKGDDIDRIIGLELGADDYVSKPCNPRELLARIHAVLKRSQPRPAATTDLPASLFQLDSTKRSCHVSGEAVTLTGTEFDLLYLLLQHKGEIIDKATLSEQVLQRELQPFDRSIDVHISRLRKKLAVYHDEPIRAVRGKGYQLTA